MLFVSGEKTSRIQEYSPNILQFFLLMPIFAVVWDVFK